MGGGHTLTPLLHTAYDWDVAARTLFGEARGEPLEGLIAVAWTIRNRVERPSWWGHTVAEVCQKKAQFSCWNMEDPNREIILTVQKDNPPFRICQAVITYVFAGYHPDPTQGATHYFTSAKPVWATVWPPIWAEMMTQTAVVGSHLFYRELQPEEQA